MVDWDFVSDALHNSMHVALLALLALKIMSISSQYRHASRRRILLSKPSTADAMRRYIPVSTPAPAHQCHLRHRPRHPFCQNNLLSSRQPRSGSVVGPNTHLFLLTIHIFILALLCFAEGCDRDVDEPDDRSNNAVRNIFATTCISREQQAETAIDDAESDEETAEPWYTD